jgi:hypothetical protein
MSAFFLVLVCWGSFAHAANQEIPRYITETYASESTLQDLTNELRYRGIPQGEVAAIETFIKSQGLSLTSELAKEKLQLNHVSFGSQKLSWDDKLQIKSGLGRILKFDRKQPADQVYIQTYNALMKQDVSAYDVFLPKAHAQVLQRAREAASAAGWNVLMWTSEVATTGGAAIEDAFGSAALLAERIKTVLANSLHGHVKCGPKGEYIVDGTYKYYDKNKEYRELKRISEEIQAENVAENPNSYMSRGMTAVGRRMLGDGVAKLKALTTMFTLDKNKDVLISDAFLKKVWAPKPIQKCDPEYNAKIVEGAWRAPGRTIDEKVRNFQNDSYGPKYNYDYDDLGQPIQPRAAGAPARSRK